MRQLGKKIVNRAAAVLGARMVNSDWGPRGFEASFQSMARAGWAPRTVLDIGASTGSWSRQCMKVFPSATYFLAEPLLEKKPSLDAMAASNPNVSYFLGGVGATEGIRDFNAHDSQSSFLESAEFKGTKRNVPVRTLDQLVAERNLRGPMLLKADVQGYELEVLAGAKASLPMIKAMLLEVSFRRVYQGPLAHDVVAEAGRLGYRIFDVVSYVQRGDGALAHADIVFVRDGSSLFANERWGAA